MAKLTLKQRRAIRRAPKRAKAAMARRFGKQRGGGSSDAAALRGIKQGVGRAVARPFGGSNTGNFHPCSHDAFHMAHLPLPRPTGPYSVVRTTQQVTTGYNLNFFGPMMNRADGVWSSQLGVGVVEGSDKPKDANNSYAWHFSQLGADTWNGAQVTPSAFSVQVMNPQAIQTTSGILYLGRIRTALKLTDNLDTVYNDLANYIISYNNPRLCAAAKMAFRGVQVDLVPFNMAELANFTKIESASDTTYTVTSTSPDFVGFAPMFIWNPSKIPLQLLICCEWRTRFDPSNPAQATHVQHQHAPESFWAQAMHGAEAIGNGVVDIAERVANTGNAIYNGMGSVYRVARGARALMGPAQLALM